jgi:DnaJ-class molecular chaperone
MPAKLVDCPCDRCGGSGTSRCRRCSGSGHVTWGACWGCHGTGEIVCPGCGGKKRSTLRTWVPDTIEETRELVQDLERAIKANENGWIWVNALRRGYRHSGAAERDKFFPKAVIDQIIALEKQLAEPCLHCQGQGVSEFSSGEKCGYCRGSGFAKAGE